MSAVEPEWSEMWVTTAPLGSFLRWLAAGWSLPFVVEPIGGHHRHYSILLMRTTAP